MHKAPMRYGSHVLKLVCLVKMLVLTCAAPVKVINSNRRCRDLIYLILFAAFWAGMLYVAYLAFKRGMSRLSACSIV